MSEAAVWRTIDEEAGVWSLTYPSSEPPGEESADQAAPANCIVMRVGQSQLAVLSPATDMTDAAFMELEKHGRPVALIAPSGSHHLGQPRWQARYSQARCFAPKGAIKRIASKHPQLRPLEPLEELRSLLPDGVWIGEPPGMRAGDAVARTRTTGGHIWYFNDLIMNMAEYPSSLPARWLFKLTGTKLGFGPNRVLLKMFVKDKAALKTWLLEEIEKHPACAVVPGHGAALRDEGINDRLVELVRDAI